MLGRSPSELFRQPVWALTHEADRERERRESQRLLAQQPRFHQSEKRFVHSDGHIVHCLASVSLALDAESRPLNFIWQVVDVTEQRHAERERARRIREQAARAEAEAVADTIRNLQVVTEAALEHLALGDLLEAVVDRITEIFDVDTAAILLLTHPDDDETLTVGAATDFKERGEELTVQGRNGFAGRILSGARSVTVTAASNHDRADPLLALGSSYSLLAVPLRVQGRVRGVVQVGSRTKRKFTLEEESLLGLAADRAGMAIEHARLYAREQGIVETLQRSLLPERLPRLPGVQLAARYLPGGSGDVGGDWYDAIKLDGGRVGLVMGDVAGHGIGAASLMGVLRNALRAYATDGHPPAAVLDRLDKLMRGLDGYNMATLLFMVVEPSTGSIQFASAGHLPALVVLPEGGSAYLDLGPDPPLGVGGNGGHSQLAAALEPGSTLLLFTDGLVEERSVSIDRGLDRLREAAERLADPDRLCEQVVESLLADRPISDDVAVLALRAVPAEADLHFELPSDPAALGGAREALARWLEGVGASSKVVEELQLACHEACSNSIEHGYRFGEGTITVHAAPEDGDVVVTVSDRGGWARRSSRETGRGNGLPMMETLTDDVDVEAGDDGTTVRMRRRIAPVGS